MLEKAAYRELEEIRELNHSKIYLIFLFVFINIKFLQKSLNPLIDAGALNEFDYPRKTTKENIALLEKLCLY